MSLFKNPITSLTKDKQEQRNLALLGTNSVLRQLAIPLYSGEVSQTFYVRLGLDATQMTVMGLPGTILYYAVMIYSALFVDRIKNRILANAVLTFCGILGVVGMLVIALGPASFKTWEGVRTITIIFAVLFGLTTPLYGAVSAMVDCRTVHNEIRGRFWSMFGILSGVLGIPVGIGMSRVLKDMQGVSGFALCFAGAVLLSLVAALLVLFVKELPDLKSAEVPRKESPLKGLANVITMKQFLILMPANILRGIGDGAGGYIMYVVVKKLALGNEYVGYVGILASAGLLLGYLLMGFTLDRFGAGRVIPFAEIFLVLGLMCIVLTPNRFVFLGAYLLWQVMRNIEAAAIPLAHYEIVPTEVMGTFSSIRLMLLGLTGTISSMAVGFSIDRIGALAVFSICSVLKLMAGAMYCYGIYSVKRHVATKPAA